LTNYKAYGLLDILNLESTVKIRIKMKIINHWINKHGEKKAAHEHSVSILLITMEGKCI